MSFAEKHNNNDSNELYIELQEIKMSCFTKVVETLTYIFTRIKFIFKRYSQYFQKSLRVTMSPSNYIDPSTLKNKPSKVTNAERVESEI